MDLEALIETAEYLQIDPVDLATVISYETGGTFDPMQAGPTTQWGQHRGLIQFGEPQARQHGVDFSSPEAALRSQLGPDGAIVSYLLGSGFEPGMGILDLYSTINAGGPGLYNRTDANNGGAPGTVREKVEQQFGGHRNNALRLFGGEGLPAPRNHGVTRVASAAGVGDAPPPVAGEGLNERRVPGFVRRGNEFLEDRFGMDTSRQGADNGAQLVDIGLRLLRDGSF